MAKLLTYTPLPITVSTPLLYLLEISPAAVVLVTGILSSQYGIYDYRSCLPFGTWFTVFMSVKHEDMLCSKLSVQNYFASLLRVSIRY